jgi:hypothetical protein
MTLIEMIDSQVSWESKRRAGGFPGAVGWLKGGPPCPLTGGTQGGFILDHDDTGCFGVRAPL